MGKSLFTYKGGNKSNKLILLASLVIFSLLPGVVKLSGGQLFFLFNIPIIFLLFLCRGERVKFGSFDVFFLIFFLFLCLQTIIWTFFPFVNQLGLYMGFYMYVFPMLGFFLSRRLDINVFLEVILIVCTVHAVIGIMIYPMFGIGQMLGSFSAKLREGTGIIRMGSVSGSLGFGNLMLVGFVSALAKKRAKLAVLFFFCIICSMQRSAWLAGILSLLAALFVLYDIKKGVWILSTLIIIGATVLFIGDSKFSETFLARFDQLGSNAAGERSSQWDGGIQNFLAYPFGSGVGQVGQVGTRYENNENFNKVPDGDFFRILSETGFVGAIFYLSLFSVLILCILNIGNISFMNRFLCILVAGYSLQMIGSNITEFYFTNFLYWIFIGFFFRNIKINTHSKLYSIG